MSSLNLPDEIVCEVKNYLVSYEGGRILRSASAVQRAINLVSRSISLQSSLWEVEWRITFVRYMWKYLVEGNDPVTQLFDNKIVSIVIYQTGRCENRRDSYPQDPSLWFYGQHYRMIYKDGKWKVKNLADWSDCDYRRNGLLPPWVISETGWQWPIVSDDD